MWEVTNQIINYNSNSTRLKLTKKFVIVWKNWPKEQLWSRGESEVSWWFVMIIHSSQHLSQSIQQTWAGVKLKFHTYYRLDYREMHLHQKLTLKWTEKPAATSKSESPPHHQTAEELALVPFLHHCLDEELSHPTRGSNLKKKKMKQKGQRREIGEALSGILLQRRVCKRLRF